MSKAPTWHFASLFVLALALVVTACDSGREETATISVQSQDSKEAYAYLNVNIISPYPYETQSCKFRYVGICMNIDFTSSGAFSGETWYRKVYIQNMCNNNETLFDESSSSAPSSQTTVKVQGTHFVSASCKQYRVWARTWTLDGSGNLNNEVVQSAITYTL